MTLSELLQLAAIITANAPLLIDGPDALSAESLTQYWSASKCRQQRWARSLKQIVDEAKREDDLPRIRANRTQRASSDRAIISALLDEIFVSEVLTRVFAAIAVLHDRRRQAKDAEPVVRSVWLGHLESRRRALTLLASGLPISPHEHAQINRRRRRAERWNDLLIGRLCPHGDVDEFAFEPDTAAQFAQDFRDRDWHANGIASTLVLASLQAAANRFPRVKGGNGDLHQQIGAAVLGCFGHGAFDSLGLPRSLWVARLLHTADSAHGLVERLFAADRPAALPESGFIIRRGLGGCRGDSAV